MPTPTNNDDPIVASNISHIGKKSDADDMAVIITAKPRLGVSESGDRFGYEGALRERSAEVIGAVRVEFPYQGVSSDCTQEPDPCVQRGPVSF